MKGRALCHYKRCIMVRFNDVSYPVKTLRSTPKSDTKLEAIVNVDSYIRRYNADLQWPDGDSRRPTACFVRGNDWVSLLRMEEIPA